MEGKDIITFLLSHGIKPTANRVLVARELDKECRPLSLMELERSILTIDKSGIYRALVAFRDAHMVHVVEGSEGVVSYELCRVDHSEGEDDTHPHFYCECCHELTCLDSMPIPDIPLPEGYRKSAVNYTVKGICPKCAAKAERR